MASGIPTRRTTRRVDENAPPAASTIATRSRSNALSKQSTVGTSIPIMKRTASSTASASTITAEPKADIASKRRAALGELPLAGKGQSKAVDGKGKAGPATRGERRPLASTQPMQQTKPVLRAKLSGISSQEVVMTEDKVVAKRKASTSRLISKGRPVASNAVSAISSASTSAVASKVSTSGIASKKLRITPGSEEEVVERLHKEAPDSSVRDPVNETIERRPKDFGWVDLDVTDADDPTMVSEYVVDAFKYMLEIEPLTMPNPNYMAQQNELQWKMRAILMDWLIDVHQKFRLLPETLLIATNLIDRFLSARVISLIKFQLVGMTALFIASKYEEIIAPSITNFLHMCEDGYQLDEILRAERYMLTALDFDLSYPNPIGFLRRASKAEGYNIYTRTIAKYLIEINCVDHHLLSFTPSKLAAAALWLARLCYVGKAWDATLVHYSSYSEDELQSCAQAMLNFILDPEFNKGSAFFKKYAGRKHLKVAVYVRDWAAKYWPESLTGNSPIQGRELQHIPDMEYPISDEDEEF